MSEKTVHGASPGLAVLLLDSSVPQVADFADIVKADVRVADLALAPTSSTARGRLRNYRVDVVIGSHATLVELAPLISPPTQVVLADTQARSIAPRLPQGLTLTDTLHLPAPTGRVPEMLRTVVAVRASQRDSGVVLPDSPPHQSDTTSPRGRRLEITVGGSASNMVIAARDVGYIRAEGDYVRLFTSSGAHLVRATLSGMEMRWSAAGFIRIHRTTLVRMGAVTEVVTDEKTTSVRIGQTILPVSRRLATATRATLARNGVRIRQ